ncbi:MAG: hypothetical protein O2894_14035, partial [Planctomycetota bacterium]|nr:hypothetical protein [Planctomycetota bacterium]
LARDRAQRPRGVAELARGIRTWQKQRAIDRELDVLLAEAEGALTESQGMTPLAMRKQSERASTALRRVLELRPGEARATALLERARTLAERGLRTEIAHAQRRLARRLGVAALIALAVIGVVVAALLDQRRQEAESAHATAQVERDNATQHRLRAEEAIGFITEELRATLEPEGRLDVLAQIGEKAREHFAAIPIEEESARGFRQRMQALHQLGEVYLAQGTLPRAREVFEEAARVSEAYASREAQSEVARFERGRADVNLARVDHAQGYPRRGSQRVQAVVEQFDQAPPTGVGPIEWNEARVRAWNTLATALRGTLESERARAASDAAQAAAAALLDLEGIGLAQRKLAIESALLAAGARFDARDPDAALVLAEDALADARQLLGSQPEDMTLQALALAASQRVGWVLRFAGRFDRAQAVLSAEVGEARRLVGLRPGNMLWRGYLTQLLYLLGDARAGPEQAMGNGRAEFEESYDLAGALHEHDPSHAGWLYLLINLCDRRAAALNAESEPARQLEFRRRAAEYARKLSALEPGNAPWRYLLAFTLGTLASRVADPAERRALLSESRAHNRYALERIPDAHDVNDFYLGSAGHAAAAATDAAEAHAILLEAIETRLGIARRNPDAYWVQAYLVRDVSAFTAQLREHDAADADRLVRAVGAFLTEQAARGEALPAAIAAEMETWVRAIEAATVPPEDR